MAGYEDAPPEVAEAIETATPVEISQSHTGKVCCPSEVLRSGHTQARGICEAA